MVNPKSTIVLIASIVMVTNTRHYKTHKRIRSSLKGMHVSDPQLVIEASSMSYLFKRSLKDMAQLLKPGFCKTVSHSDCMMKLEATGVDHAALLIDFLTKTIELSIRQHTIFCSMYMEHFSETKLTATLFGSWFDHYDQELKTVAHNKSYITRKSDLSYRACIVFQL